MNFIRSMIGKHRLKSENKSLDISKITPRMYAMSYPSDSFFESMYHNDVDDIAEFLNKNHPKKYLIFNLSGKPYNPEKFNNSVKNYYWPDHKAPPLSDIFNIIYQAFSFLTKDKEHVICIHCLAGKGRTGTVCCILLLYAKLFLKSDDANKYFSLKRFKELDKGVQEPSQVRYLRYFDKILSNKLLISPKIYEIKDVYISGIKLKDGDVISYKFETNYYKEALAYNYKSSTDGQIVLGDVTINIYKNDKLFAWVFFNTNVEDIVNNRLFYNIQQIDPRFLLKEDAYKLMTVDIVILPYHRENNKPNNLVDEMMKTEYNKIQEMNKYLNYAHNKFPSDYYNENKILFFGDEELDFKQVLNNANQIK